MVNKIASALIRGATVKFIDREWQVFSPEQVNDKLLGEIEDALVNAGYNMFVAADTEDRLILGTHGKEPAVH